MVGIELEAAALIAASNIVASLIREDSTRSGSLAPIYQATLSNAPQAVVDLAAQMLRDAAPEGRVREGESPRLSE